MQTATLSSKFQLSIPKTVRDILSLEAGQKFAVITKGKIIELVPIPTLESMRGILKGKNATNYRDRQDRG